MKKNTTPTRRSFLKGGALLAAPIAAGAAPAILADDGLKARIARLEDEVAIRELHQTWLRRINTGASDASDLLANRKDPSLDPSVRSIVADHTGEPDTVEVAADGKSATGRFRCSVEFATAIGRDSTLAQMAHAQGGGFVRRTERRILNFKYAKTNGVWEIATMEFASL
jgi:hypothetical protein